MKNTILIYSAIIVCSLLSSCTVYDKQNPDEDVRILYGNVITMKAEEDRAEAVVCKDGQIIFVGTRSAAEKYVTPSSKVLDYGDNYIYPGFMDAHVHGMGVAVKTGGCSMIEVAIKENFTLDDYAKRMKEFIDEDFEKNKKYRTYYKGSAMVLNPDMEPHRSILDKYIPDVPVIIETIDGHSVWVNTKTIEVYNIKDWTKRFPDGDELRVDADGYPTGYISEKPALELGGLTVPTKDEIKPGLLEWQEFAFSKGLTAVSEALVSAGTVDPDCYIELAEKGLWKLRTYASYIIDENTPDDKTSIDDKFTEIFNYKKEDSEYFKIIGVKLFMDGVIEAHTGWLKEEYADLEGYYGLKRITNKDRMKYIVRTANSNGMNVHCHSIGDGATSFALDCLSDGQKEAGVTDARNTLAHLHIVDPGDIQRFADNNIIAVVAPLWVPKEVGVFEQTCNYIGKDRAEKQYPINSFLKAGAHISFHSDYPVSLNFSIPLTFYAAVTRTFPELGEAGVCGKEEAISRYEALQALTTGCAYSFKEEKRLGSIEVGKIANFTVLDQDLMHEQISEIPKVQVVATIIDEDVVWPKKAK